MKQLPQENSINEQNGTEPGYQTSQFLKFRESCPCFTGTAFFKLVNNIVENRMQLDRKPVCDFIPVCHHSW